jgi:serine/threonine protein kinase
VSINYVGRVMRTHGRYTILKKIADGGMAEIFLATQSGAEGFARTVILKRILPAFSGDLHFRNMLVDEAHIAMSLNHSNIVPVLDLGESNGRYFLVLELVDGWDLATIFLRANKADFPLPPGLALHITGEVCRGLSYAHSKKSGDGKPLGIVHRDISPQNVLVSDQGEVKVTDFGIAKALGKRERTQTGVIKGKLDFMSPEQASGAPLDASSDIFSVGAMLYLLTTGKRAFEAPSDLEALLKVQRAEFVAAERVNPALSPQIGGIISKAMQERPSQRYRTAEEMMLALEEVLRNEFSSVGQSDLKRWLGELGKRDRAPTALQLPGLPLEHEDEALPLRKGHTLDLEETSAVSAFDETRFRPATPGSPSRGEPGSVMPVTVQTWRPLEGRRRGGVITAVALALVAAGAFLWVQLPSEKRQAISSATRSLRHKMGLEASEPATSKRATGARMATEAQGQGQKLTGAGIPEQPRSEPRSPTTTPARRAADLPGDQMRLTLVTRPPGASVVGPSGSMGKTPFTYTARVGSTQALTFAKDGFVSTTRRITANPKRPTVVVDLVPRKKTRASR